MKLEYRAKDGRLVLIDAVAVKVTDVSPQPTVPQPTPVVSQTTWKPNTNQIVISQWAHQNDQISQDFIKKYLVEYIAYLRDILGKYVESWLAQVTFQFYEEDTDKEGLDDKVAVGFASSRWAKINVGAYAKVSDVLHFLSAETAKSCMLWLQYDNSPLQHIINDRFTDLHYKGVGKWNIVIVDDKTFDAFPVVNYGMKLGEG